MSKKAVRFLETHEHIYSVMDEILVVCPHCQACASITRRPSATGQGRAISSVRRLVCSSCGCVKTCEVNGDGFNPIADPVRDYDFGQPLWLQIPCCGHILWAYNYRHLALIEKYIQADLREQRPPPRFGWSNGSLVQRLPEWVIVAKHREAVLDAIAKLKRQKGVAA